MSHPFARTILHLAVVGSTNDLAKERVAEAGVALPLVVRADRQTRGRGRGAHAWWSDSGSLTFSIGIDPAAHGLRPEHEPRLALAAAVAVIDALGPFLTAGAAGIRWPNDVEVAGRKLGGILPERVEGPAGPRLVVGVGLNLSTDLAAAPAEVRLMATTVAAHRDEALAPADVEDIFGAILAGFARVLDLLARDDPSLPGRWNEIDTLAGRPVRVDLGPRIVAGLGRGIDARGGLLLTDGRETWTVYGGQVLREESIRSDADRHP
jgi:BirA family biotin operon repressor/biotin-[acetyl-CoA-carboxylase] ligase